MSTSRVVHDGGAGYAGCTQNQRCFYEGSRKESFCTSETMCVRDMELRRGSDFNDIPYQTSASVITQRDREVQAAKPDEAVAVDA